VANTGRFELHQGHDGMTVKIEEVDFLPPETQALRLEPETTYLLLVKRGTIPIETFARLSGAFEKNGLKPPIILQVWDPEKDVRLYMLKKEGKEGQDA
jgi:hypothetical protein